MSSNYNSIENVINHCTQCEICDIENCPRVRKRIERMIFIKRILDIIISIVGVIVFGLFYLVLAIPIKLDGGPVLFKQVRVGKDKKPFKIYKFRTMHVGAEERLKTMLESDKELANEYYQTFKLKSDPRLTIIGKFLRKSSLDELPQFINVLKGEMSIIGPRPVSKQEVNLYYVGRRARRIFKVRPGLSGMWQVNGRSDIADYRERVRMDSNYIDNWSLWLDIHILFKTIAKVLSMKGAY